MFYLRVEMSKCKPTRGGIIKWKSFIKRMANGLRERNPGYCFAPGPNKVTILYKRRRGRGVYTYVVVYVWVVGVVKQRSFVHFLRFFRPVEFEQNVSAIYVRLRVIGSHADGLPVKHVRLFQTRLIFSYQIGQIQQNV